MLHMWNNTILPLLLMTKLVTYCCQEICMDMSGEQFFLGKHCIYLALSIFLCVFEMEASLLKWHSYQPSILVIARDGISHSSWIMRSWAACYWSHDPSILLPKQGAIADAQFYSCLENNKHMSWYLESKLLFLNLLPSGCIRVQFQSPLAKLTENVLGL